MFFKLYLVRGSMRNLIGCYGDGAAFDRAAYKLVTELQKEGPCCITGWVEVNVTLLGGETNDSNSDVQEVH